MSELSVRKYLEKYHLAEQIKVFDESSATVILAAKAAGVEPGMIAKTITFMVNERAVLIVTAGDRKIDNAKFKAKFGVKAKMLTPDEVEYYTGHTVGGVCPFDIKEKELTEVYLDESLRRFSTVLPAAGSCNSCVYLKLQELETASEYREWVDVCKPIQ